MGDGPRRRAFISPELFLCLPFGFSLVDGSLLDLRQVSYNKEQDTSLWCHQTPLVQTAQRSEGRPDPEGFPSKSEWVIRNSTPLHQRGSCFVASWSH